MSDPKRRRVVVTGVGALCSLGTDSKQVWSNALQAVAPVSEVPSEWLSYADLRSRLWSPLPEIDFREYGIPRGEILRTDPVTLIGFIAAREALQNAGFELRESETSNVFSVPGLDPLRTVIYMGSSVGGSSSLLQNQSHHLLSKRRAQLAGLKAEAATEAVADAFQRADDVFASVPYPKRFNGFIIPMLMPNAVPAYLGIKFSLHGHNNAISLACASGTSAVGHAFHAIADGRADAALCGGSEFLNDGYGSAFRGFDAAATLTTNNENPQQANRPFDEGRAGFLFSEGGAAALILEEYESAKARGAPIVAEVCGYAETFDAHSMLRSAPDGVHASRMFDAVLEDAGISAAQIGYVNTHGTGTELNDKIEAEVIGRYFDHGPRITASKSLTGHTIGAAGALEAVFTALSLQQQTSHACHNLERPIADLNFVREVGAESFEYGVSHSFAFGGHNAAVVMKRAE